MIEKIHFNDIEIIEKIGSKCLPIYYKAYDILFLLCNLNYLLFKISVDKNIIGFLIAKKKYETIKEELNKNKNENKDENNNIIKRYHIMSICVLAKYRKNGYGTQLIKHLEKIIFPVKHISLYVLTNNYAAIKLYEKNNFKKQFENKNYYMTLETKSAYYYEK